jgi:O-antigen ligase
LAVALLGRQRARRLAYAAAALVLAGATLLTFSRGALLLGVPASLAVILLGWRGRRALWVLGGALAAGLAALPLAARLPRFASLLDLSSGTSFFRTRLWVSAWRMFLDHPSLGVGPDNFLYFYRSRYILPEAWEEPDLSHPHNLLLDFLTRLGALGLVTGLLLQFAFWRQGLANHRRLAADPAARDLFAVNLGLLGLMADMLAHGLVDHGFFLVDLAFVFFLALGLIQHLATGLAAAPIPTVARAEVVLPTPSPRGQQPAGEGAT